MSIDLSEGTFSIDASPAEDLNGHIYVFGDFELHKRTFELFRSGQATGLQLKPTTLLLYLIEHHERTVTKEELIEAIWPDTYVSESSFTTVIRQIRQALNEDGDSQSLILTFRGRGYRFVGAVTSRRLEATPESADQTAGRARPPEPEHWLQPRHPVMAVAGGLAITLLIAAVFFGYQASEPALEPEPGLTFDERDWVLIANFENKTGESLFDDTLEYALGRTLANSRFINVVPRQRIQDTLHLMKQPPDTRVDAALGNEISLRDGGIRALLTGRIEKFDATYVLSVQIVNVLNEAIVASLTEEALGEGQVWPAVRRLASSVRQILGEELALIRLSESKLIKVTTPSLRALKLYSKADSAIRTGIPGNQIAEQLLQQAIADDPEFASAYTHLAWAIYSQGRPLDEYLSLAKKALVLADQLPDREKYFIRGSYFHMLGQIENAITNYKTLLQLHPDHPWASMNLRGLLIQQGNIVDALVIVEKSAVLRPNSFWTIWAAYSLLTYNGGDLETASGYYLRALKLANQAEDAELEVAGLQLRASTLLWLEGDLVAMQAEIEKWTQVFYRAGGRYRSALAIHLGFAHGILGQQNKANEYYRIAARHWPNPYQNYLIKQAWENGELNRIPELMSGQEAPAPFEDEVRSFTLALSGLISAARKHIPELEVREATQPTWVLAYRDYRDGLILYKGGKTQGAISLLASGLRRQCLGDSIYVISEVLANAWLRLGNTGEALRVLERAAGDKLSLKSVRSECRFSSTRQSRIPEQIERMSSDVWMSADAPGFVNDWMRIKLRQAQIYRQTGRDTEAERIEDEIRTLLVYADADNWMVRYLEGAAGFVGLPIDGPYNLAGPI